jgi:hypothetical protein
MTMELEIRKSSHWWYGVFTVDGRKTVINLGVPITGKRPPKRTMLGDDEFERSRGRAQEAYRVLRRKMREDRTGEKSLKKLAEMKTGKPVSFPEAGRPAGAVGSDPAAEGTEPGLRQPVQAAAGGVRRFRRAVAARHPGLRRG